MKNINLNQTGDMAAVLFCFNHLQDSCPRTLRLSVIRVAMYAFMLTTILMTVCGNLLVIIAISHFKQLHSPTNFILLSLALVDCCLGCCVMPFSMLRTVEGCWYLGKHFCTVHFSLDIMLSTASILHLCLVSVDRYWAICHPLQYKTNVSTFKMITYIIVIWLTTSVFSFGLVFSDVTTEKLETLVLLDSCIGSCVFICGKQCGITVSLVGFFIPGTIMSCLYIKIFHVARKHARVISDRMAGVACHELKNRVSEQRERKAAKTLAIVMCVFLLCWVPFFCASLVDPFLNFVTPVDVVEALFWFGYFNSTCNPVIYAFFYLHFRKAFKIIIAKIFGLKITSTTLLS
ncbi:trace amine-associated receptor 4-like [Chanos chanos]|uniref:Trace amine-associated receptor 4-like n=1 Tax=Chanos chanos TaxID=29144 RepID=A0A6J2VZM5_CHACN|nr:trace amine-associated receptor 4-like [Chanos chanos]